jgi:hypothetical protein
VVCGAINDVEDKREIEKLESCARFLISCAVCERSQMSQTKTVTSSREAKHFFNSNVVNSEGREQA